MYTKHYLRLIGGIYPDTQQPLYTTTAGIQSRITAGFITTCPNKIYCAHPKMTISLATHFSVGTKFGAPSLNFVVSKTVQ